MSEAKDTRKDVKKNPAKSLMEKRAAKWGEESEQCVSP